MWLASEASPVRSFFVVPPPSLARFTRSQLRPFKPPDCEPTSECLTTEDAKRDRRSYTGWNLEQGPGYTGNGLFIVLRNDS